MSRICTDLHFLRLSAALSAWNSSVEEKKEIYNDRCDVCLKIKQKLITKNYKNICFDCIADNAQMRFCGNKNSATPLGDKLYELMRGPKKHNI